MKRPGIGPRPYPADVTQDGSGHFSRRPSRHPRKREHAARIQRQGVVNALDDEHFAAAVKATDRPNLIIARVTNDVCTVFPTLSALRDGYQVQVVADAGDSPTVMADKIAINRMQNADAVITSTNQVLSELAGNWTPPGGAAVLPIIMTLLPQQ